MKIEQISAEYREHMGSDLSVVNAARTSFGKESDWDWTKSFTETLPPETKVLDGGIKYTKQRTREHLFLKDADANLIRFLATGFRTKDWDALLDKIVTSIVCDETWKADLTEILLGYKKSAQHWAPFGHPHMQIRMKLPMFLARQFVKHQVGGVWSEESRRYMSSEPEFWFPKEWHGRPEDVKQGSEGVHPESDMWGQAAVEHTKNALAFYTQAVASGIAPEEARIILPLNTMTTVTWTGSLLFWSRVCNHRLDSHAQLAAQELGRHIAAIMQPLYPVSWAALVGDQ